MKGLYIYLIVISLYINKTGFSANELYIKGPAVNTSTATLINNGALIYVSGEINNADGLFVNTAGTIELTGDWTNTLTNNAYQSTGTERFKGTSDQTIKGTWNGTTLNQNQFYDLKINKTSSTGETIILDNGVTGNSVNVNAAGSLAFEGSNGIIRTQSASIGTSDITATGDYTNKLYLQNSDPAKFTGYSTGTAATTKYIEGKLQQQLIGTKSYYYPVGVKPTLLGGMNAFNLDITSISASTAVVGYVKPYSTALVTTDYTFCDVAKVDNNTGTANYFSTCIGPPDGMMDLMRLTNHTNQSWEVTPQVVPASVNYNITVYPTTSFNSSANFTSIPCGTYGSVKYLARNGVPGGNTAVLGNSPAFQFRQGYFMCITGNALSAQNGFSNYQLWGADNTNTNLPVELTEFKLTPVNNEYFQLDWHTASELNNRGFEVQRSIDRTAFTGIGFINGNGTSNVAHDYTFEDKNVTAETNYYFRLKQTDFDGTFRYSNMLQGRLKGANDMVVSDFFPNPTDGNVFINVYEPLPGTISMDIYDVLGQAITRNDFKLTRGWNKIELNTSLLAPATYIARISYDDKILTKKIIKK